MSNQKTSAIENNPAFSIENQILGYLEHFPGNKYMNHHDLLWDICPKFAKLIKNDPAMTLGKFQESFREKFVPLIIENEDRFVRPLVNKESYKDSPNRLMHITADLEKSMQVALERYALGEFFSDRVEWKTKNKAPLEEKTSSAVDDIVKES